MPLPPALSSVKVYTGTIEAPVATPLAAAPAAAPLITMTAAPSFVASAASALGGLTMKQLVLGSVISLGVTAASAQLFTNGAPFKVNTGNSPGTASDTVTFSPGTTQTLNGGKLSLKIDVVPAGGGAEWAVFTYHATDSALSQPGQNWSIEQVGLPSAVPLNFIGDFTQFTGAGGVPFNQTNSIFGQILMANPVPGGVGNGEGSSGFSAPFAAGPLPSLGAFSNPFSIVTNALGTTGVDGFTQALEFAPQTPLGGVPEAQTWMMLIAGFGLMGLFGFKRRRHKERLS